MGTKLVAEFQPKLLIQQQRHHTPLSPFPLASTSIHLLSLTSWLILQGHMPSPGRSPGFPALPPPAAGHSDEKEGQGGCLHGCSLAGCWRRGGREAWIPFLDWAAGPGGEASQWVSGGVSEGERTVRRLCCHTDELGRSTTKHIMPTSSPDEYLS